MGLIKLIFKLLVLPLIVAVTPDTMGRYFLHAVFDRYLQSACWADVPDNDCRMDVRHQRRSRNAPTAGSYLCGLYHPSHCRMADYQNLRD